MRTYVSNCQQLTEDHAQKLKILLIVFPAMSIFSSLMVLLLILVEAAPPTASSVPTLGKF